MENTKICQSCEMPMTEAQQFGTNKDTSRNEDYCIYCFKEGDFIADMTMDEMIEVCTQYIDHWEPKVTKEQAVAHMKEAFPKLKRWKN